MSSEFDPARGRRETITVWIAGLATLALAYSVAGSALPIVYGLWTSTASAQATSPTTPKEQTSSPTVQAPGTAVTGIVTPPRSPRNANYSIDARLDPATRTISASATLTWRNISNRAAEELQFHLYWNAWRNELSTFLRSETFAEDRNRPPEDFSSIDVTSIKLLPSPADTASAAIDLTSSGRFIAPDDRNRDDQTVLEVPLPEPVSPGETITVEMAWTAMVPRTFARTGAIENFFFIAQWFPKIGVFEDEGWNTHQFHASTEFFADYGVYDVSLTVPQGWTVGATGVERGRADNTGAEAGTTTHRYYQEDVHDFAWTTSPEYIELIESFEYPTLPPVALRLLLQPEHQEQADRHFEAARAALKYYGEWFGAYPYGHLTVVDPAYQSGADGMEYPTLITAGTSWLVPTVVSVSPPEEVVVHEIGHQFFYGLVGTNEFEHAWMDEGITTYSAARVLAEAYPDTYYERRYFGGFVPWTFRDVRLKRETNWNRLPGYRSAAESDSLSTPSYRLHPRTGRLITYNKAAVTLNTMERWLGWATLRAALAQYVERWQFAHPKPEDFFDAVSQAAGRDLNGFIDQAFRSSNVFDYGVEALRSTGQESGFRTEVVVRRFGEATFPVDVLVTFDNGDEIRERWDGVDRWKAFTYDRASRARSAQVDPGRVLLLDVNYTNNSRTLSPRGSAAATKWGLKWMVWLQDALLTWGLFI